MKQRRAATTPESPTEDVNHKHRYAPHRKGAGRWSVYGAKRAQSLTTGRNCGSLESGSNMPIGNRVDTELLRLERAVDMEPFMENGPGRRCSGSGQHRRRRHRGTAVR